MTCKMSVAMIELITFLESHTTSFMLINFCLSATFYFSSLTIPGWRATAPSHPTRTKHVWNPNPLQATAAISP